jgi:hypothetical protein
MPMLVLLVPPLPGGRVTFPIASWNIRSGWGAGLAVAAKGLCQMCVGCVVLTETKLSNNGYPRFILGYQVILLKAASPHQGGIALMWKMEHWDFGVLTFQLVTVEARYDLCAFYWAKCLPNWKPLLLWDLNINFGPRKPSQVGGDDCKFH